MYFGADIANLSPMAHAIPQRLGLFPFIFIISLALASPGCGADVGAPTTNKTIDTHDLDAADGTAGDGDSSGDATQAEGRWWVVHRDLPPALLSAWGSSHDDIWFTGADIGDGTGPWVIHGTSSGFQRLDFRPAESSSGAGGGHIWWAFGPGERYVWFCGENGRVFRYDREEGALTRIITSTEATLYGLWGSSDDNLYAVGGFVHPKTGPPVIVHIKDGVGTPIADLPTEVGDETTLFKVWGTAADDVYVIGEGGVVLHWDGAAWSGQVLPGEPRLVTIHGQPQGAESADRVIVGGASQAVILENKAGAGGAGWVDKSPGPYSLLNGVYVSPDGSAFAAGMLGQAFRRSSTVDGAEWTPAEGLPLFKDWHAVWTDPRGDTYVVGGNLLSAAHFDEGAILRFGPPRTDTPYGPIPDLRPVVIDPDQDADVSDGADVEEDATDGGDAAEDTEQDVDDTGDADGIDDTNGTAADTSEATDTGLGDTIIGDTTAEDTTAEDIGPEDIGPEDVGPEDAEDTTTSWPTVMDPGLSLGHTETGSFVLYINGQDQEIVQGGQGGIHIETVVRFPWDVESNTTALPTPMDLFVTVDGAAPSCPKPFGQEGFYDYHAAFRTTGYPVPRLDSETFQSYVIPIIFCNSNADYLGLEAVIEVTITLPDDTTRTSAVTVNLVDLF